MYLIGVPIYSWVNALVIRIYIYQACEHISLVNRSNYVDPVDTSSSTIDHLPKPANDGAAFRTGREFG